MRRRFHNIILALVLAIVVFTGSAQADPNDLNFDGVLEIALDLPRLHRLLKLDVNGLPLEYEGKFEQEYLGVFLDTGASGILLSRETAFDLGITIDPEAEYIDIGVGGIEVFDVSEPLYIGTDFLNDPNADDPNNYLLAGPWRFQVKRFFVDPYSFEYPYDLLGMPVMAGKTVILYPGNTNNLDYFAADIREPNDPIIPPADFNVPLRFEKYISPNDPIHTPPLPVLAYNPVIDNVTVEYNGQSSTGTWLFDTGASISIISSKQAARLGLTDSNGTPIIPPDFVLPIGGIGGQVELPGYQIDNLIVPTLNGYNLVYNNARICIHDISIIDEDTNEFITLDGIFGSNFLCASATLSLEIVATPYNTIVIDTQNGLIGFDVDDVYPLPEPYTSNCGDANNPWNRMDLNRDCRINFDDIQILLEEWLEVCTPLNWDCRQADINGNGTVDFYDYAVILKEQED